MHITIPLFILLYNRFSYIRFSLPQYKSLPRMGKQLAGSKMKWRNGSDKARSSHHIRRAPLRIQEALPQCRARITILVTTTSAASISEHVSPFPDQLFRGSFLGSLGLPGRGNFTAAQRPTIQTVPYRI